MRAVYLFEWIQRKVYFIVNAVREVNMVLPLAGSVALVTGSSKRHR